jgi:CRISPR/Cas system-associated exonuclease Cas4 (RecB family)
MNAELIKAAITERLQKQLTVYPCNNLRASNIGHPCERYLYLLIKHWDEQVPPDISLQGIFNLGNSIEEYTIKELREAGLEVITPVARSWKINIRGGVITGREDIRVKDPEDGQLYPAEIKGLSPYEWERLNCIDDFFQSKRRYVRGYPAQLFTYMFHFGKEKGFFILTNKLTGAIKPIEVALDYDYGEQLLSKGERVYAALNDPTGNTIPAACEDISVCESCSLRHICTAAHERPEADIDDGELEAIIDRKNELKAGYDAYNDADKELKRCLGEREKVIAGKYIVTVKTINKAEYTVKARQERRVSVSRL